jgi:hypothetical protein
LDLKSLVETARNTVYQLADGSFETQRARLVGQVVAHEFRAFHQLSPKVSAAKNVQAQPSGEQFFTLPRMSQRLHRLRTLADLSGDEFH